MTRYIFPLFLLLLPALACQAATTPATSLPTAVTATGRGGEAFVFYKNQVFYWIDSHKAERQVLMGSHRLESLAAALSRPHFLADNLVINSDGRLYSFERRDGVVAPYGHRLAYVAEDGLHTQYINGAEDVLIAADGREPVWHVDGQLLAFQQGNSLMVTSPVGDNPRHLFSGQSPQPLAWSPDGERLLFQDGTTLAVVGLTSGEPVTVGIDATMLILRPQWMADGRTLLAGYPGAKGTKLVTINTADGRMHDLITWDKESGIAGFAISPADGRIAFWAETCRRRQSDLFFSSYEECGYRVHVADGNGRNIRQLDTGYIYLDRPAPPLGWAVTLLPPVTLPPAPDRPATPVAALTTGEPTATTPGSALAMSEPTRTPATLPTRTPTPTPSIVPFGDTAVNEMWTLTLLEVIRGAEAEALVAAATSINPPPAAGQEYLLVRARLTYNGEAGNAPLVSRTGFQLLDAAGRELDRVTLIPPAPAFELFVNLTPQETTHEGWLAFTASQDAAGLTLRFRTDLLNRDALYLALP